MIATPQRNYGSFRQAQLVIVGSGTTLKYPGSVYYKEPGVTKTIRKNPEAWPGAFKLIFRSRGKL